jgi:hypothetical protein
MAGTKLLDRVREVTRTLHDSIRTEDAYVHWVKRFVLFHGKRHPLKMDENEVEAFLTHLAVDGHVAASTQNQALSALLFLYKSVLDRPEPSSLSWQAKPRAVHGAAIVDLRRRVPGDAGRRTVGAGETPTCSKTCRGSPRNLANPWEACKICGVVKAESRSRLQQITMAAAFMACKRSGVQVPYPPFASAGCS